MTFIRSFHKTQKKSISNNRHKFYIQPCVSARIFFAFDPVINLLAFFRFAHNYEGVYTESSDIDPKLMSLHIILKTTLLLGGSSRPVQSDVVNKHLARTARRRYVAFCPQADRNPVNIVKAYSLIR